MKRRFKPEFIEETPQSPGKGKFRNVEIVEGKIDPRDPSSPTNLHPNGLAEKITVQ